MTQTVVLTRPKPAMAGAKAVYLEAGFEVLPMPCFDVVTNTAIQASWLSDPADVTVFLSVHALEHTLKINPEWQPNESSRVIAIGPAVVAAWRTHFDHPIESHALTNSEGVITLLTSIQPQSIHIFTTQGGRELIQTHCMQNQISYAQFNTYVRVPLALDGVALEKAMSQGDVILTATSVGVLKHWSDSLSDDLLSRSKSQPVVVAAERIAHMAKSMGFKNVVVAENASDAAMCFAVNQIWG